MFEQKIFVRKWLSAVVVGLFIVFTGVALAQQIHLYVMKNGTEIKSGPGTQYETIETVNLGIMLEVVGEDTNQNWLRVKSAKGKVGWVSKDSITYQKLTPSVLSSKKGAVDFELAKEQVVKWWKGVSSSATPVCDICNAKVPRDTGYVLSSKQVLSSRVYHEMLKTSFSDYYSTMIENFEKDQTPWLVCDKCIDKYFVNVSGASNVQELEKAMLADKALQENILKAVKKQYSIEFVRDKVEKNELWIVEDKERGTVYPISPLMGKELLQLLEKESKKKEDKKE